MLQCWVMLCYVLLYSVIVTDLKVKIASGSRSCLWYDPIYGGDAKKEECVENPDEVTEDLKEVSVMRISTGQTSHYPPDNHHAIHL